MRVFEITQGKKKLEVIAGLVWHPLEKTGGARAKEIRAYADESNFDFKVIRGTDAPHVGLARRSDGAKAGHVSAAAIVADVVSENDRYRNFLVAIPLPGDQDQYLQVVSHERVIIANGDQVGTRDEIRVKTTQDAAYGNWDLIICPGEWGIPKSSELGFDDIFNPETLKKPGRWALTDVSVRLAKFLVPTVLLLCVAMGSFYAYRVWNQKRMAAAEALRLQNEEVQRGQRTAIALPVKPWPSLPTPAVYAAACDTEVKRMGFVAGNWTFSTMECGDGFLRASWARTSPGAWVSHMKLIRPDAVFSFDGSSASVSVPLMAAASNDFTEGVPLQEDVVMRFTDIASRYGIAVKYSQPAAPVAQNTLPGQQGAPQPPPPPWAELPVEFKTGIDPLDAAGILQVPGLRLTKISYSVSAGAFQYSLSGVQYVHR